MDNQNRKSKIKVVTAVDAVVNSMSEAIYKLEFQPGQQVSELELSEHFGVSRNTVREASTRLIVNGLMEKEANHGLYVRKITPEDVRDIYQTRAALEIDAIGRICADGPLPEELYNMLRRVERNQWQGQWYESVNADVVFHTEIIRASGSTRLLRLYKILSPEIKLCLYQSKLTLLPDPENKYKHGEIIAALEKHDAHLACSLVENHIAYGCRKVLQGFEHPAPQP